MFQASRGSFQAYCNHFVSVSVVNMQMLKLDEPGSRERCNNPDTFAGINKLDKAPAAKE